MITLKDLNGNTLQVSLWGSRATEFNEESVYQIGQNQPVIIILVRTLMKSYKGPPFLSGTSACWWYINEDIPDINEFYTRLPTGVEPVQQVQLDNEQIVHHEVQAKTVLELKDIDPFDQVGQKFKCNVTITRLIPDQPWWYLSCTLCHSKARMIGSGYKCTNDNCISTDVNFRYRLCLLASDETYQLQFVLFGEVAQDLIGKLIQKLQAKYDKYELPQEISKLIGHNYTFIFKVSPRSMNIDEHFSKFYTWSMAMVPRLYQLPSSLSSLSSTGYESSLVPKNLPPLTPIKYKEDQKQENTATSPFSTTTTDPMEIEETEHDPHQDMHRNKRSFTTLLSTSQAMGVTISNYGYFRDVSESQLKKLVARQPVIALIGADLGFQDYQDGVLDGSKRIWIAFRSLIWW